MRRLALFVGSVAAPALACSLAVSTSGLAGSPLEPDAGAGPDVAATTDGGAETGLADAGAYCAQHPAATFCADFDEDSNPTAGFTDEVAVGDNSTSLSDDAVSRPHALLVRAGRSPSVNAQSSARPYKDLPFIAKSVHVELDAKLCALATGSIEFLKVETSSSGLALSPGFESADVALSVDLGAGESALAIEYIKADGSGGGGGTLLAKTLPRGTWFHLALDIVFAADATGSVTLYVDRDPTPVLALTSVRTLTALPSTMRVLTGTFSIDTSASCTNLFDNLLVEATP